MSSDPPPPRDDRRFVFTTVGTDHHPFDRLVGWMARWHREHAEEATGLVQHGSARAPVLPEDVRGGDLVTYEAMVEAFADADVVVSHGGPATIVDARQAGTLPIVVARRQAHGEHVDDHQVRFADRLAGLGQVVLVDSYDELATALDKVLLDPGAYRLPEAQDDATLRAVEAFAAQVATLAPHAGEPAGADDAVRSGLVRTVKDMFGRRGRRA